MEITGKIVTKLPVVTGQGSNGEWRKQEFIIETAAQYPKKVCLVAWSDKVETLGGFNVGANVTCSIDVESREYNNRWYTDVKAWKIESAQDGVQAASSSAAPSTKEDSELPF